MGPNRFNYVRYTGSFHIIQELEPDNDYAGFIFGYQDNRYVSNYTVDILMHS